ncbi:cysteine methyltransferase [Cellvibrio mixtus]|uniref:Cysteine methyltransferase n=2 Tax=Cellvibrionaceae TaxID=1706371 RepID=A0A266Q8I7_9GAMM|nr:cysteine methyltransferase [Cellvibrio mixtus]
MMSSNQHKEAIYLALMTIPPGKVVTYGELAKLAGLPGAARLAGRLMSGLSENTTLPWHRVINAQGRLSLPEDSEGRKIQQARLEAEGVIFERGKINLRIYRYNAAAAHSTD